MTKLTFEFISICLPDYLLDHHNRHNEKLVSCDWYEGMSHEDLVRNLIGNTLESEDQTLLSMIPDDNEEAYKFLSELIAPKVAHYDLQMDGVDEPDELMCYGFFKWNEPEIIEYTVPTWVLPVLFNGDETGLTEEQIDSLNKWLSSLSHGKGHWSQSDTSEYFSWWNEVNYVYGNVCQIEWVVME